jgi:excisionase family DNA binding protein
MSASSMKGDTLYGVSTIARFLGKPELEVRRLVETGELPVFMTGKLICGSKTKLREWRVDREEMAGGGP